MRKKNSKLVKPEEKTVSTNDELVAFIRYKIINFQDIINKTIVIVQKYKLLDIIGASELNVCINGLENLHDNLIQLEKTFYLLKK